VQLLYFVFYIGAIVGHKSILLELL